MKRMTLLIAFAVGAAAELINDFVLYEAWFALGWRKPVANWLSSHGWSQLAGYWSLLWLHLPDYLLAIGLGLVVAWRAGDRWIGATCWCALGFLVTPHLVLLIVGFNPWSAFGAEVVTRVLAWKVVSVVMMLVSAAVVARVRRHRDRDLPEHACANCGYDLRGTLAAGRENCPECGQSVDAGSDE